MTNTEIEAHRDRIIITGPCEIDVQVAMVDIFVRVSPAYIDFTSPVMQADGRFVATGLVRLQP